MAASFTSKKRSDSTSYTHIGRGLLANISRNRSSLWRKLFGPLSLGDVMPNANYLVIRAFGILPENPVQLAIPALYRRSYGSSGTTVSEPRAFISRDRSVCPSEDSNLLRFHHHRPAYPVVHNQALFLRMGLHR